MAFDPGAVGRAVSEHRFDEALPHIAKDVRWTVVGYMVLEGADAVRQTCRETLASLEDTTTTYDRCVIAVDDRVVAVDTLARYAGPNGTAPSPAATSTNSAVKRSRRSRHRRSRSTRTTPARSRHRASTVESATVDDGGGSLDSARGAGSGVGLILDLRAE
jgi:hypothetical protein